MTNPTIGIRGRVFCLKPDTYEVIAWWSTGHGDERASALLALLNSFLVQQEASIAPGTTAICGIKFVIHTYIGPPQQREPLRRPYYFTCAQVPTRVSNIEPASNLLSESRRKLGSPVVTWFQWRTVVVVLVTNYWVTHKKSGDIRNLKIFISQTRHNCFARRPMYI